MPFLTQTKTNWKFIWIVAALAVIVGGGILYCIKLQESILTDFSEGDESKTIKTVEEDLKAWSVHKNKELGFEIKIPPIFEQNGCFINEGVSAWSPFGDKECHILSFETGPTESQFADPSGMGEMILIYICPLDYCEEGEFKEICEIIRNGEYYRNNEDKYREAVSGLGLSADLAEELMFILWGANHLTEGKQYIAYFQTFHGQGDLWDYMGWLKEDTSNLISQMLASFQFIDTRPQEKQDQWHEEEGSTLCYYDDTPSVEFIFPDKLAALKEGNSYEIKWKIDWWRGQLDLPARLYLLTCDDSECNDSDSYLLADVNISTEKYSWLVLSKDKIGDRISPAKCYKARIITIPPDTFPPETPLIKESECFNIEWLEKETASNGAFSGVRIYTTLHCIYCDQLKDFLEENNIDYEEVDVSSDEEAARELRAKVGQMVVPVTEIAGEIIIGFDRDKIAAALGI